MFTDWTVDDLAWFIGALLVFRGTFTLFSVPVDAFARSWSFGHGLIELGVGIAVWVWPAPTLHVIAAFIGWLLLFRGTMAIAGSISARRLMPYGGVILAGGIAEVAVAFYLLSRPALTLVAAVLTIGLVSMAYGVLQIILAFEGKNLPGNLDHLAGQVDDSGSAPGLRLRERPDGPPVNMAERTERRALVFVADVALASPSPAERDIGGGQL